jgi:hypothetical protein
MAVGIAAGETKTRKPVDESHPCVAAAVAVLKRVGGPLPISVIFDHAHEMGLLPASSVNTIRGRLSQHVKGMRNPSVVPLSGRRGWTLAGTAAGTPAPILTGRLRDFVLTPQAVRAGGAPADFVRLVELSPGGTLTVRGALMRHIDGAGGLDWLLAGAGGLVRFPADVVERLRRARGIAGRARVIHAIERRDNRSAVA